MTCDVLGVCGGTHRPCFIHCSSGVSSPAQGCVQLPSWAAEGNQRAVCSPCRFPPQRDENGLPDPCHGTKLPGCAAPWDKTGQSELDAGSASSAPHPGSYRSSPYTEGRGNPGPTGDPGPGARSTPDHRPERQWEAGDPANAAPGSRGWTQRPSSSPGSSPDRPTDGDTRGSCASRPIPGTTTGPSCSTTA